MYERIKDFYRTGWRPFTGWGLGVVAIAGGIYEFVLRHFYGLPGNDVMAFVAYLTAIGAMVYVRKLEKEQGNG